MEKCIQKEANDKVGHNNCTVDSHVVTIILFRYAFHLMDLQICVLHGKLLILTTCKMMSEQESIASIIHAVIQLSLNKLHLNYQLN